jgi:hypothetical protein
VKAIQNRKTTLICKMSKILNNILVLYNNKNKSVIRDYNKYKANMFREKQKNKKQKKNLIIYFSFVFI